jgi:hypothetical protein
MIALEAGDETEAASTGAGGAESRVGRSESEPSIEDIDMLLPGRGSDEIEGKSRVPGWEVTGGGPRDDGGGNML